MRYPKAKLQWSESTTCAVSDALLYNQHPSSDWWSVQTTKQVLSKYDSSIRIDHATARVSLCVLL